MSRSQTFSTFEGRQVEHCSRFYLSGNASQQKVVNRRKSNTQSHPATRQNGSRWHFGLDTQHHPIQRGLGPHMAVVWMRFPLPTSRYPLSFCFPPPFLVGYGMARALARHDFVALRCSADLLQRRVIFTRTTEDWWQELETAACYTIPKKSPVSIS